MARLKSIVYKLQKALTLRGRYITINQTQFYSEKMDKMRTKYILKEKQEINGELKNVILLETYNMIDVINFLADLLNGGE